MRVIGGKARGMTLKTIEGDSTRPTRDMVREALFSILLLQIPDCRFLDLFAGSGAVGIEAISRGADSAILVDNNPACIKIIKENITKAHFEEKIEVYNTSYQNVIKKMEPNSLDIIFIDPPYHQGMGVDAITRISEKNILSDNGIIVLEIDTKEIVPNEIRKV